ncbi:hypothetical protein [Streptomyces zhihengii]|uniref:Integral membrane protein n=1 Tax=Streptomyces zhihengii TaxID=1818004 RepID=A0ABS2URN4_9ACTN|nr:hypothetical protein [Streptomyces zhihengii]MBM9620125.1 hypothetical protein [Streptomyces zhihengii]
MSDHTEQSGTTGGGPRPEPLRYFGTTWVEHDGHYGLRRAAVAAGSLVTAFAAALVLRFAYQGLSIAEVGGFVNGLVVVMFAVCSAIAFRKTWESYTRRPSGSSSEDALRGLKAIGFIGSLIAYALRCFVEAPGEGLRRAEYEKAKTQYARRRTTRSGNPAHRDAKGDAGRGGRPKRA